MLIGFAVVVIAGLLQGTFLLPMSLTRNWRWEHTWLTFSVCGMVLFNWAIALIAMPNLVFGLKSAPLSTTIALAAFGLGWGVGALLFGVGMDRLGLALGYPIIMGLVACLGSLIPLAIFAPRQLMTMKGCLLLAGTALAILGIALCSIGGLRKEPDPSHQADQQGNRGKGFLVALIIAILAGILSCLPNVGVAFGQPLIHAILSIGVGAQFAPSAVFVLFFTFGGLVNVVYCLWRIQRLKVETKYFNPDILRNLGFASLMAVLWIGSFHLYGIGSGMLGEWGLIAGWPLFICISIATGVFWGLTKGEWKNAPLRARQIRNAGIMFLFFAMIAISASELK